MKVDQPIRRNTASIPLAAASRPVGVLVERPVNELGKHPVYAELQLTVSPAQLAAIQYLGDFAFHDPLLITRDGVIIDGYARKEVADRMAMSTLSCVELDIDEHDALRLILSKHRRSSGWNDYNRIRMASRLKDVLQQQARTNQEAGGRFKGRSKLTEANVRKEIATAAGVSAGNVTKVDQLRNADPEVLKALANGEIRIHRGWLWRALAWPDQREQLRLYRLLRLKQNARARVSKHRLQGSTNASQDFVEMADLGHLAQRLSAAHLEEAEPYQPITIGVIDAPVRLFFLPRSFTTQFRRNDPLCEVSMSSHPLKQILLDSTPDWDHDGTPRNVRENFWKIINCGTEALGAEVYASATETKIVYHTCKSRFCPSCGARAASIWQEELEAALPNVPYVEINFTMPKVFWPLFQRNRHVLNDLPALGAEAIQFWANARYRARVIVMVVQQTYGGFLNFHPHLHTLVSAGGLDDPGNRWIQRLKFDEKKHRDELMFAWRSSLVTYLDAAIKANILKCDLGQEELGDILRSEVKRFWNIYVGRPVSKQTVIDHIGRYIRKPPIVEKRLKRVSAQEVQYLAKDTRNGGLTLVRYTNREFIDVLIPHVMDRFRNSMRYFGLLAPRSRGLLSAVFLLLGQQKMSRPVRLSWASSLERTFGTNPLSGRDGRPLRWVGRLNPAPTAFSLNLSNERAQSERRIL